MHHMILEIVSVGSIWAAYTYYTFRKKIAPVEEKLSFIDDFQNHHKLHREKIKSYEAGFYWSRDSTWYYIKKKASHTKYSYFESETNNLGSVTFQDNNVIKLYLDDFLEQYLQSGTITVRDIHPEYEKYIKSDLYIKEEYKDFTQGITFKIYDIIHNQKKKISEKKIIIIQTFRYFGFDRVPSSSELRNAYLKLAKELHPDNGGTNEKMTELNLKYEMVKIHTKQN